MQNRGGSHLHIVWDEFELYALRGIPFHLTNMSEKGIPNKFPPSNTHHKSLVVNMNLGRLQTTQWVTIAQ